MRLLAAAIWTRAFGAQLTDTLPVNAEYDYIVVGGGAAGCVIARVLADAGFNTLLIERGSTPEGSSAASLYGLAEALTDPILSQPIVTTQGVRTHLANVLGGGTSVNLGIWIEENEEYFEALLEYLDTVTNHSMFSKWQSLLSGYPQAQTWLRSIVTGDYKRTSIDDLENLDSDILRVSRKYMASMEAVLSDWFGPYRRIQPQIKPGTSWSSYSLFNSDNNPNNARSGVIRPHIRNSAAKIALAADDYLTILLNSTVLAIVPRNTTSDATIHDVQCVEYVSSPPGGAGLEGTLGESTFARSPLRRPDDEKTVVQRATAHLNYLQSLAKYTVYDNAAPAAMPGTQTRHRVCITGAHADPSKRGEVILSAGAIKSPWILFNSGIGPVEYTKNLRVKSYLDHAWIGKNFLDRPLVGFSLELKPEANAKSMDMRRQESVISANIALALKEDIYNTQNSVYSSPARATFSGVAGEGNETERSKGFASVSKAFSPYAEAQYYSNYSNASARFYRKVMGFEDLFGGDIMEGVISSSRLLFPPAYRNAPTAETLNSLFTTCSRLRRRKERVERNEGWYDVGSPMYNGLAPYCRFLDTTRECFKNTVMWWTFLPHIRSRGHVGVSSNGKLEVHANYLGDLGDQFDMVENFQSIINMMSTYKHTFDPVFLSVEESQCPRHDFLTEAVSLKTMTDMVNYVNGPPGLVNMTRPPSPLPFATQPQIMPSPSDQEGIMRYIENHIASMWHHAGTVPLGLVLDDEFHISGVSGLSVIDASTLPLLPRMNPVSSIMAIAKLAADRKVALRAQRNRQEESRLQSP